MNRKISFDFPDDNFKVIEIARLAVGAPSISAFIRDAMNNHAIAALNCTTLSEAQAKAEQARAAMLR
jgi:hypothetical protein